MPRIFTVRLIALCAVLIVVYIILTYGFSASIQPLPTTATNGIDIGWYPPSDSWITDLDKVINGEGTFGFRYGGFDPEIPGQYSYCDMEHVRPASYILPSKDEYELKYVEVVCIIKELLGMVKDLTKAY